MKWFRAWMVLMCFAALGCDPAKDSDTAAGQEQAELIEPEGLWILDIENPTAVDVMEIVKRGGHYAMRAGRDFGSVAHMEQGVLVTMQPEGDVTFSEGGSIAHFNGRKYRRTNTGEMQARFPEHYESVYRSKCIDRIHKIQLAVRRHEVKNEMKHGDPLDPSFLVKNAPLPTCPGGGTYTFMSKVPLPGELYCTCSHAKDKGHVPANHEGW